MRTNAPFFRSRRIPPAALALSLTAGLLVGTQAAVPAQASAAPPAAAKTAAAKTAAPGLTAAQASAQAKQTGKPVVATGLTTEMSETTANVNGSFTLTESATPTRVRHNGAWVALDANLVKNTNGTVTTTATPSNLTLSDGGTAPLAVMSLGGQTLSLTLPVALPTPTLSGPVATYSNVIPGVTLVVTATDQGGFSDIFVIGNAEAAADPELASLLTATTKTSQGLTSSVDSTGAFAAVEPDGSPVFTAPTPTTWDSATTAGSATTKALTSTGNAAATDASGAPAASSAAGPGAHAAVNTLKTKYSDNKITIAEPASLLPSAHPEFPVFVDPEYGPTIGDWSSVNSYYASSPYMNNSMTTGMLNVGYCGSTSGDDPCTPGTFVARSYLKLNLSSVMSGATITAASMNFTENWAYSCTTSPVGLYTNPTLTSSNDSWNTKSSPTLILGSQTVSYGHTGCATSTGVSGSPHGVTFDQTNSSNLVPQLQSAVNSSASSFTVSLEAGNESDPNSWKVFTESDTTASITYYHAPKAPTLTTNPGTTCSSSSLTTLGDDQVNLQAATNDVDGTLGGTLNTTFDLYATSNTGDNLVSTSPINTNPGGTAIDEVSANTLQTASTTGGVISVTEFAWTATTTNSDGQHTTSTQPCYFKFDATTPGLPQVADNPASPLPSGVTDCPNGNDNVSTTAIIGTQCSFTISPAEVNGVPSVASGYLIHVNQSPGYTVNAADPGTGNTFNATTGDATITVDLPRLVNTLTVNQLSAGGNIGPAAITSYDGEEQATQAVDGDINNDGIPDLITTPVTGGALPSGLWLADGNNNGTISANATNIGADYPDPTGITAEGWDGTQAISGDFCGDNVEDVLFYIPGAYDATSDPNGGGGGVLCGDGSNDSLTTGSPNDGPVSEIPADSFESVTGTDPVVTTNASEIANAGNTSGQTTGYPDVLATIGSQLFLFHTIAPGDYTSDYITSGTLCSQDCVDLSSTPTPDGSYDWSSWTISTYQTVSGATDMYLWNSTSGVLDLWTNLSADNNTPTLSYTSYPVATNWNTNQNLQLRAADINSDGTPDLWATNPTTGQVTADIVTNLSTSGPATVTAGSPQTLTATTHNWALNDDTTTITPLTGADTTGTPALPLTGNGGTTWDTSDPTYAPDVAFNGTSGFLTTSGPAVTPTASFSVSVWAKPSATGAGTVLSQNGSADSEFTLSATSGNQWSFALNTSSDGSAATFDTIAGGTVQAGAWAQLTATYNASTGVMTLYANNLQVATGVHALSTDTTGNFLVGADQAAGANASFFNGQILGVQTWNTVQPPNPAPTHDWALDNGTSGIYPTAADTGSASPLPLGGTSGASWNTSDPTFSPDVSYGPTGGLLTATGPAIATNADFTVSTWVKPTETNGIVLSQMSTGVSAFVLYANTSGQWVFALNNAPSEWTMDSIAGGAEQLGVWTQLTATYKASTGIMVLYADGVEIATGTHTASSVPAGEFEVGDDEGDETNNGLRSAQVADVETWNQVVPPAQTAGPAGYLQTLTPTRILDTRKAIGVTTTTPVPSEGTVKLQVAGVGGIPATGVTAVGLTITTVNGTSFGNIVASPDGTQTPVTSNVNYTSGLINTSFALVPVGSDGQVDLLNQSSGTVNVIADTSEYFTSNASATGDSTYTPLTPTRFLDTRTGSQLAAAGTEKIQITGVHGVPAGATAVAINLTALGSTATGQLTAYPDGATLPSVTSNSYQATPNMTADMQIVPLDSDGAIDVYNSGSKATDLLADVSGYFVSGTGGQKYHSVGISRLIDTRQGSSIASGATLSLPVAGGLIVPGDSLIANITALGATAAGDLTVYSGTLPGTSTVNFVGSQTIPDLALPEVGTNGAIDIIDQSSSSAQVLVDLFGYFANS